MSNNPKKLFKQIAPADGKDIGTVPDFVTIPTNTISSAGKIITWSNSPTGTSFIELQRTGKIRVGDWIYSKDNNVADKFALRKIVAFLDDAHLKIESGFTVISTGAAAEFTNKPFFIVRASRAVRISYSYGSAGLLNGIDVPSGFSDDETKASKIQTGQDFIDPIAVNGLGSANGIITSYLTL